MASGYQPPPVPRPGVRRRPWALGAAVAATVLGLAPAAAAKTELESPYTYQQTFGSALRLLKVDLGLKVTDQDPDWGYLLFEYTSRESGNRKSRGSIELVRTKHSVHIAVQLAAMPSYHERALLDRLKQKLSDEHGSPPPPKADKPPPKAGADDDDTSGEDAPSKNSSKSRDAKKRTKT